MVTDLEVSGSGNYWVKMHGERFGDGWRVAYLKFEYEGSFYYVGLIGEKRWRSLHDIEELGPMIERPALVCKQEKPND